MITEIQSKKAEKWFSWAHLINDVYTGMLNPLMPFIAEKLSFTLAFATLVISLSHIFASVLQPVIGFFADNSKRRTFIFRGLLMSAIFIPLAPAVNNKWLFILLIVLGSLGSSLFHPQALGLLSKFAEVSKKDVAKAMAIFMFAGSFGFALGPLVSSSIAHVWGLNKIFWVSILGIICALMMFKCVPKINNLDDKKEHFGFKKAFGDILKNRELNLLFFIAMIKTLMINSCTIFLPFLWKDLGHGKMYIGAAIFAFTLAGSIASLISPYAEKKLGTKTILYLSLILTLPLLFLFVATYQTVPLVALTSFILIGAVTMMASPVIMVLAQNIAPEYKSIIAGFVNGFAWGVIAIVMTILGVIAENAGIINLLMAISVIPVVSCIAVKKIRI
ncbi:MFS transporter [bacterium]|nr:MFS transporter [bacterium]